MGSCFFWLLGFGVLVWGGWCSPSHVPVFALRLCGEYNANPVISFHRTRYAPVRRRPALWSPIVSGRRHRFGLSVRSVLSAAACHSLALGLEGGRFRRVVFVYCKQKPAPRADTTHYARNCSNRLKVRSSTSLRRLSHCHRQRAANLSSVGPEHPWPATRILASLVGTRASSLPTGAATRVPCVEWCTSSPSGLDWGVIIANGAASRALMSAWFTLLARAFGERRAQTLRVRERPMSSPGPSPGHKATVVAAVAGEPYKFHHLRLMNDELWLVDMG